MSNPFPINSQSPDQFFRLDQTIDCTLDIRYFGEYEMSSNAQILLDDDTVGIRITGGTELNNSAMLGGTSTLTVENGAVINATNSGVPGETFGIIMTDGIAILNMDGIVDTGTGIVISGSTQADLDAEHEITIGVNGRINASEGAALDISGPQGAIVQVDGTISTDGNVQNQSAVLLDSDDIDFSLSLDGSITNDPFGNNAGTRGILVRGDDANLNIAGRVEAGNEAIRVDGDRAYIAVSGQVNSDVSGLALRGSDHTVIIDGSVTSADGIGIDAVTNSSDIEINGNVSGAFIGMDLRGGGTIDDDSGANFVITFDAAISGDRNGIRSTASNSFSINEETFITAFGTGSGTSAMELNAGSSAGIGGTLEALGAGASGISLFGADATLRDTALVSADLYGIRVIGGASGEEGTDIVVLDGADIESADTGIWLGGLGANLQMDGDIFAEQTGIEVAVGAGRSLGTVTIDGRSDQGQTALLISSGSIGDATVSGTLEGSRAGIVHAAEDDSAITISGVVSGQTAAVIGEAETGDRGALSLDITSTGIVSSTDTAIRLVHASTNATDTIVNAGTIEATVAIETGGRTDGTFDSSVGGGLNLTNSGELLGNILLSAGSDTVVNTGRIDGEITLGGGNDSFVSSGAGRQSGRIDTGSGNDFVQLGEGVHDVVTGDGDDRIVIDGVNEGNFAATVVDAGSGNDRITIASGEADVFGRDGDDIFRFDFVSTVPNEQIAANGGAGNDTFFTGQNSDVFADGGEGEDTAVVGLFEEVFVFGDAGFSLGFNGDDGETRVNAGSLIDIEFVEVDEIRYRFDGENSLATFDNNVFGADGTIIQADRVNNLTIDAGGGRDYLLGNNGADRLFGGDGSDIIVGAANDDELYGDYFLAVPSDSPEALIFRAYQAVFDRAPDEAGFKVFRDALELGQLTQQQVIEDFVTSPEFQDTYGTLTNREFVNLLYENVLDRPGDPASVNAFTAALDSGVERSAVVIDFANSAEFIQVTALPAAAFFVSTTINPIQGDIYRAYQAVFDREPDVAGFDLFVGAVAINALSLEQVVEQFVGSQEFQDTYGALSNTDFIELLYDNVLPGNEDPVGRAAFVAELDAGRSRASIVNDFVTSVEFRIATEDAARDFVNEAYVNGLASNDILIGGTQNDTLFGGRGRDTFVTGQDADIILDFTVGEDTIDLSRLGDLTDTFEEIMAAGTQDGLNAVFDFGNGDTVTLNNVALDELSAVDFGFAKGGGIPLPGFSETPDPTAAAEHGPVEFDAPEFLEWLTADIIA